MTRHFAALVASMVALAGATACGGPDQPVGRETSAQEQPGTREAAPPDQTATHDPKAHIQSGDDAQVLADFKERVDAYVALRKKADNYTAPLKKTEDPAKIRTAQQGLAEQISAARSSAKPGDIFTPESAAYFRRLLRPETKEAGTKAAIKDDNPESIPFKVNGAYPEKEPLSTVPPNVLQTLPALPDDLEYRFVGKHMILRDVRANLIIDYMTNAIP